MGTFFAHVQAGPYHEVYSPSYVGQNARYVLQQAKEQVVLIEDKRTTLAAEAWTTFAVERRMTHLVEALIPKGAMGVSELQGVVSDWSPIGGFTEEVYAVFDTVEKQPRPHFKATKVHRSYREVLDAAKREPVYVQHKEDLLTFDLWEKRQFEQRVAAILHEVVQFQNTRALAGDRPASIWAYATPYPWVAPLPEAEIEQFANDLMPYLVESVRRGSLDGFDGNLAGWQTAAQVHGNKMFQDALARAGGSEQPVEITRPQSLDGAGA